MLPPIDGLNDSIQAIVALSKVLPVSRSKPIVALLAAMYVDSEDPDGERLLLVGLDLTTRLGC